MNEIDPIITKAFSNQGYNVKTDEDLDWARWNVSDWEMRIIQNEICKQTLTP